MRIAKPLQLIIAIAAAQAAGAIGSLATVSAVNSWYTTLEKPPLVPPNGVFGPVWITLYCLIGISLFLLWTSTETKPKLQAYAAFAVQLALNTLWSLVFFGLEKPWLGVVVIVLLLAAIVWNIKTVQVFSKPAARLLVPYLVWVGFASYLTLGIAILN
jgi:benzodiazapine receptor